MRKRDLDMNVTGPIFDYKGKEYTVQSSKECRIWLLDTSALGGEDHRTPVYRTPLVCNEEVNFAMGIWGALATWEDAERHALGADCRSGDRSIRSSKRRSSTAQIVHGAVAAFKMEDEAGKPQLMPAWISRDMYRPIRRSSPTASCSATAAARDTTQRRPTSASAVNTAANRMARSTHAILYALDAQTGDELWSSGDQIASWNHFSGLSIANGRVYIGTYDGMLYCFGVDRCPPARSDSGEPNDTSDPGAHRLVSPSIATGAAWRTRRGREWTTAASTRSGPPGCAATRA